MRVLTLLAIIMVLGFVICIRCESPSCLEEGGAPAVFQSPECSGWSLSKRMLPTNKCQELQYSPSCSYSLADCIVDTSLERGSIDNVAAVGLQNYVDGQSGSENVNSIIDKFRQLSVEGKRATYGSFYLLKSLNEIDDYTFWISKDEQVFKYVSLQALPDMLNHSEGGPLTLHHGGDRGQCIIPKVKEKLDSFEGTNPNARYILKKRLGQGGFGEAWVAVQRNFLQQSNNSEHGVKNNFVVKRIMVEKGNKAYLSGIREKYFGELFVGGTSSVKHSFPYPYPHPYYLLRMKESVTQEHIASKQPHVASEEGLKHIARYIESFESKSDEIWLVFRHEGVSLSTLLYTADNTGGTKHPSNWWRWLKTTKAGQAEMKSLIWQLLIALKFCHDRNITHRDIKPENIVVCFEDQDSGRCLKGSPAGKETYITKMRVIDFGSAMDDFATKHLYGAAGPSRDEQTYEYMPPEALLNATWYHGPSTKYDMWSAGVVILELILGSPDVFQIDGRRTHALMDQLLHGWNEDLKKLAYKLRSLMDLCILLPGSSAKLYTDGQRSGPPALWKCSEEFFSAQIKSRDSLKIGFPNVWALRLVRQLLVWDPEDRLTADDALRNPLFEEKVILD